VANGPAANPSTAAATNNAPDPRTRASPATRTERLDGGGLESQF